MMRSLYSGVAGLKTHQTKMDVIGNNIANVNTVAYKSSSVSFTDLLYQTTQNASGANAATGRAGINAKQIGLGVTTGAITSNISQSGSAQTTGNPFDIRISGSSFFVVSDGSNNYFTRSGAFTVDANGTLCMSSNGYDVMGWGTTTDATTGAVSIVKDTVKPLNIMSADNSTSPAVATTKGYFTGILDSEDGQITSDGDVVTLDFYDSLGYTYTAKFNVKQTTTAAAGNTMTLTCTDILNSDGVSIFTANNIPDATKTTDLANFMGGTNGVTLTYDSTTGKIASIGASASGAVTVSSTTENADKFFSVNMSALNGISTAFTNSNTTAGQINVNVATLYNEDNKGTSTASGKGGDLYNSGAGKGCRVGTMSAVSIGTDGKINATYTNGQTKLLGQIAVAEFANASGLEKEGENLYAATQNSGDFDGIGVDITADGGSMSTGELEMSNVDLSSEFTDMITTQRGFQANSRIITVSDTMLEELVNLKR